MSGCYVYMHGEKEFFDVDSEVDTIAKVVNALEDARLTPDQLSSAVYQAIQDLRSVALVDSHIEYLDNLASCGACGHQDDRREMLRFVHNTETVYTCDEDCQEKVLESRYKGVDSKP